jgi:predicted dehydrogenase
MKRCIRIGIAGIGRAGYGMHCQELKGKEDMFQIRAACDLISSRLDTMKEQYGCQTYEKIEDMIRDEDVELIDIATRSVDHLRHAVMALKAEKYVYLEKPMCVNYEEACLLGEIAEKYPGRLFIRHNRRFDPDFLHVQDIIKSGILGEIYEVKLFRHSFSPRTDWQAIKAFGGGQLLNWGPHIIDHGLRLIGATQESPAEVVFSDLKLICAAGDAEDHLKIVLHGPGGVVADIEISGGVALNTNEYEVYGRRGSLVLKGKEIYLKYIDPVQEMPVLEADPGTPGDMTALLSFTRKENLKWLEERIQVRTGSNAVIWDCLYESIRNGKEFPIKFGEAKQVIEVISKAKAKTVF